MHPTSKPSFDRGGFEVLSICRRSELGLQPLGPLGGARARRPRLYLPHGALRAGGGFTPRGDPSLISAPLRGDRVPFAE